MRLCTFTPPDGTLVPRPAGMPSAYATETGWRRIQLHLPQHLRLDRAAEPAEEWLKVGRFAIHLDCWRRSGSPATLVLVHGSGGNGRLLAPYGAMAAAAGYEVIAPDLPGYGLTQVPSKRALVYEDWRDTLAAVLEAQAQRCEGPIIIFGLSMGGMLAYDATVRTRLPKGLLASCLLDPRDPIVRRSMVRWPWMARVLGPTLSIAPLVTDALPLPMTAVANMRAIANDPQLARLIASDPLAGGTWMPVRFLRTFANSKPLAEPEAFDVCPVLVAHPADDRWTNVSITRAFFDRLRVAKRLVMLDNAGHFPVEEPGVTQLRAALLDFLGERSRAS
jgi:alpha-beta hydrolase superfamily lysophospholipase